MSPYPLDLCLIYFELKVILNAKVSAATNAEIWIDNSLAFEYVQIKTCSKK